MLIYMYVRTYLLAIFYFKALMVLQVFVTSVVHYNGRHLVMGIVVYVHTLHALVMMLTNKFSLGYQFSSMWNLSDDEDEQRLWPPGEHKLGLH